MTVAHICTWCGQLDDPDRNQPCPCTRHHTAADAAPVDPAADDADTPERTPS